MAGYSLPLLIRYHTARCRMRYVRRVGVNGQPSPFDPWCPISDREWDAASVRVLAALNEQTGWTYKKYGAHKGL